MSSLTGPRRFLKSSIAWKGHGSHCPIGSPTVRDQREYRAALLFLTSSSPASPCPCSLFVPGSLPSQTVSFHLMLCTRLPHVLLMRRACSTVAGGTPGSGQAGPMSSGRELGLCGAHSRPTRLRIATSKASGALLDKPQLRKPRGQSGCLALLPRYREARRGSST